MTDSVNWRAQVVVGAGLAGIRAAEALREEGCAEPVVVIGAEHELPYDRPPLSKGYLNGLDERDKVLLHPAEFYAEQNIELRLGVRVTAIDRDERTIQLSDGKRVPYENLLLATGARPRRLRLPGLADDADQPDVHYLRTLDDATRLRDAVSGGARVVVIGGGWIGLEVAAAARGHGCEVDIVEPQPTPLHAVLGTELGLSFARLHREHGVHLHLGSNVEEVRGDAGKARVVRLSDGRGLTADVIVVGVGAEPNVEIARAAGLDIDQDGVLVDAGLRTSDPHVFAAGDVATAFHPHFGRQLRVEHWANALNQGRAAGRAMLGQPISYDTMPFFYSDQYDLGMEYAGHVAPGQPSTLVIRGDLERREYVAFWLDGEHRLLAGMNVNIWDVTDTIQDIIRGGHSLDVAMLSDPNVPLTELVTDVAAGS